MQKIFLKYMSITVIFSSMMIIGFCWFMYADISEHNMVKNAQLTISQVDQTLKSNDIELASLKESLAEDYLTRAKAFAYIIEENPKVLDSQKELQSIKKLLNVDELHVIDENGILFAGTIPKYFGMDFRSTKQTKEFLSILDDPNSYLVQDIQPNGAEQKIFQYAGVARKDKKGIVQVGLAPVRFLEAQKKNQLSYIFSRIPTYEGNDLIAIDKEKGFILASTDEKSKAITIKDLGIDLSEVTQYKDGGFVDNNGVSTYYVFSEFDDIILAVSESKDSLYGKNTGIMYVICTAILLTAFVMILALNHLLRKQIINGIHKIIDSLTQITNGNINTTLHIDSNPEFMQLSDGINKMVNSILMTTVKVSNIIDIVDLPIGVFEINKNMNEVLATNRLKQILNLSHEEAIQLYENKDSFLKYIQNIMKSESETEVYLLKQDPETWVKIHLADEDGNIVGIVMDVTNYTNEKRKIEHERDYDVLTGLRNMRTFRYEVLNVLKHEPDIQMAAIVMFDLNKFKNINDQFGHDWGDKYLRICARFFKILENQHIITCRRSGDEFCAFIYGYQTKQQIITVMEQFFKDIHDKEILFPDDSLRTLSISGGLSWLESDRLDRDVSKRDIYSINAIYKEMLHEADEELYKEKKTGHGYFHIHDKS